MSYRSLMPLILALSLVNICVAKGQQPSVAKLGFVSWNNSDATQQLVSLREGLATLGYLEGKSIAIEAHFTNGDAARTREVIRSFVRNDVKVIVVRATPAAHIAKEITQTIPIVMMVADPLATGLARSLAHPGGNMTGMTMFGPTLAGKRLELLREIKPGIRTIGFLGSSHDPNAATFVRETQAAAQRIGLDVVVNLVEGPAALTEDVMQGFRRAGAEAIVVQPIFIGHQTKIVTLATLVGLPVVADYAVFAKAGALLTFGTDDVAQMRKLASYVDRIIKGEQPANLPIEQPSVFKTVVNLKTAKALGLTIPPSVMIRTDEVIE